MSDPAASTSDGASGRPLVVAQGLTKRFGDFTAVDGIDFEVRTGEAFGFLGPNGAVVDHAHGRVRLSITPPLRLRPRPGRRACIRPGWGGPQQDSLTRS
jgi:hypothetical protein